MNQDLKHSKLRLQGSKELLKIDLCDQILTIKL